MLNLIHNLLHNWIQKVLNFKGFWPFYFLTDLLGECVLITLYQTRWKNYVEASGSQNLHMELLHLPDTSEKSKWMFLTINMGASKELFKTPFVEKAGTDSDSVGEHLWALQPPAELHDAVTPK